MIPISVVVMTKNEAARLPACLDSLRGCAEVFVVDSNSTDGTAVLAENWGAKVVNFTWNGQYPKKKQWCMDNIPFRYDWILYVDADERLTQALLTELAQIISAASPEIGAYRIQARPIFGPKILRFGQLNNKICLLRRGHGQFPIVDDLHTDKGEVEGHYQPQIRGTVGQLKVPMLHDCNPLRPWFERHIKYANFMVALSQRAEKFRHEKGLRALAKRAFYALPCKPLIIFFYGYIFRLGFLDGLWGFRYALARAWYYWLIDLLRVIKIQSD